MGRRSPLSTSVETTEPQVARLAWDSSSARVLIQAAAQSRSGDLRRAQLGDLRRAAERIGLMRQQVRGQVLPHVNVIGVNQAEHVQGDIDYQPILFS